MATNRILFAFEPGRDKVHTETGSLLMTLCQREDPATGLPRGLGQSGRP